MLRTKRDRARKKEEVDVIRVVALWDWWVRIKGSGRDGGSRSRGTRYGGGCIDCVRLVQREEIRQNRERTNREMWCRWGNWEKKILWDSTRRGRKKSCVTKIANLTNTNKRRKWDLLIVKSFIDERIEDKEDRRVKWMKMKHMWMERIYQLMRYLYQLDTKVF